MPGAIEIFCCYAREDQGLMKALRKHLMPLQRRGLITIWSDIEIEAGDAWEDAIKKHLESAHIILLLISSDFMASDYCYSTEMERALERHTKGEALVIPIILRPTAWKGAPFDKLQVTPTNAKPVTDSRSWISIDEALNDVIEHLTPVVFELLLPRYIDEAMQLVKQGKHLEALALYERALNQNAEYVPALYGKGAALFLLERYEESLVAYEQAIQASSDHPDARYYYGKASVLRKLQRDEECLAAYDEAIRLNPRRVLVYKEKANLLQKLERYEEAIQVLDQLTRIDHENAAEHYLLQGKLLERLARYDQALEAYNNAIKLDSNGAWAETLFQRKGDLLLDLKRYEEAADAYKQAIQRNAKIAVYHENMGKALLELNRYEEALAAYESCIQLRKGEDPPTIFDKGRALSGLERYEEALEAFNLAIRLSAGHTNPNFYHEKGLVLETLAQQAYAIEKQIRAQREPRLKMAAPATQASELSAYALYATIEAKDGPVLSSVISPNSRVLAYGGSSGIIRLDDIYTGLNLGTLSGHTLYIWCLAFLSNDVLLSGSEEHQIKVWNLPKERIAQSLVGHQHAVRCIAGTPGKQTIISGGNDNTIKFWDLPSGQELLSLTKHTQRVLSIAISRNGLFFASAGWNKEIYVWDLHTRELLHTLNGHAGYIYRLAISPNGQLIASGSADSTVKIWDSNTGKLIHTLTGHKGSVHGLDFCPDAPVLVSSGADGAIFFWNPQSGQKLYKLAESSPSDIIWGVNFSPDGQFLVSRHGSASHHGDDMIKIWRKK